MLLETLSANFSKVRSVNQTSNGYVAKIPTHTEPSGDAATATGASILQTCNDGLKSQNGILALFYGTGSNNNTFSCRVIGWRPVGLNNLQAVLWVPTLLAEFAVTLSSTYPGVASMAVVATEFFADTISLTYGNDDVSVDIVSPTADAGIAHVVMDTKGFPKIEFTFTTGGSATDCNALAALL